MPELPTLTVTNIQANRMLAAFGAIDTTKTPSENYRNWLKEQIIEYVLNYETMQRDGQYLAEREAFRQTSRGELS